MGKFGAFNLLRIFFNSKEGYGFKLLTFSFYRKFKGLKYKPIKNEFTILGVSFSKKSISFCLFGFFKDLELKNSNENYWWS